jgi:4,5-dihydroxyphthalate decarboxylase
MSELSEETDAVKPSRRTLLRTSIATSAAVAAGAAFVQTTARAEDKPASSSDKLKVKIAGYQYDRVEALIDGRVQVERCDTRFEVSSIGQMNTHVFSGPKTREVTEIGLLPFILAVANDEFRDYTLIPIFPLRVFRHKSIFIRTDRGISKPQDLIGRRVATPGYSSTSLTWIRGIMQHEYGVKPDDIEWVVSAKDSSAKASGGASKLENVLPKGISIRTGPKGKDESDLLVAGDVDALFHAAEPRAYQEGHPKVARLFADSRKTERAYFAKTGIFPIMHAVAMRRDVIQAHSWLPRAVFHAYSQAKQLTYDSIKQSAWYKTSLPWIAQEAEETRKLMGDNYWSYGIELNRKAIDALLQYSHEQGLAKRKLKIEDLFHPSTLVLKEDLA